MNKSLSLAVLLLSPLTAAISVSAGVGVHSIELGDCTADTKHLIGGYGDDAAAENLAPRVSCGTYARPTAHLKIEHPLKAFDRGNVSIAGTVEISSSDKRYFAHAIMRHTSGDDYYRSAHVANEAKLASHLDVMFAPTNSASQLGLRFSRNADKFIFLTDLGADASKFESVEFDDASWWYGLVAETKADFKRVQVTAKLAYTIHSYDTTESEQSIIISSAQNHAITPLVFGAATDSSQLSGSISFGMSPSE
ncbi:hypothetical protein [Candidatus Synchoanobacter obligatus]|uniref:Uncharacterized protein n=1 Tax=Candidatus Synchoanobacter obligatus TaxID=2919597 RepID=A0ABT1L503_9GAMM|nr:hypothetical protein [Candidatus Synchoanobacter obligatus]MCP8352257.1 hypothetical protein [Candidatus Synchoanobacter obligatus]